MSDIVPIKNHSRVMILEDALAQESEQRGLLSKYIHSHMKEGEDYGVIPGTKQKTLLKPGAEKLTKLFRCTPEFVIEDKREDWDTGLFYYRFSCKIVNENGAVVAEGVGSCSTYESRYRWRTEKRKCPNCGAEAIQRSKFPPRDNPDAQPGWYCHNKQGGCGAQFDAEDDAIVGQKIGRVQNPDIHDQVNTVLKMAKKRALVDAAISLARCSDIFTQDVEDMIEEQPKPTEQPRPKPVSVMTFQQAEKSLRDAGPDMAKLSAAYSAILAKAVWDSFTKEQQKQLADIKDLLKAQAQSPKQEQPKAQPQSQAEPSIDDIPF